MGYTNFEISLLLSLSILLLVTIVVLFFKIKWYKVFHLCTKYCCKSENIDITTELNIIPTVELVTKINTETNTEEDMIIRLNMDLLSENTRLLNELKNFECIICFNNTIDTIFMPCYHSICCKECAINLPCSEEIRISCPACREPITECIATYRT